MPVTGTTDIQQIKGRCALADVVTASGLRLRGRGRVLQGRCPFHEEREPSFTVYQDTQRFYCFGCGAMGDVLDFVQRREGLTLPEAIETLNPIFYSLNRNAVVFRYNIGGTLSSWHHISKGSD